MVQIFSQTTLEDATGEETWMSPPVLDATDLLSALQAAGVMTPTQVDKAQAELATGEAT